MWIDAHCHLTGDEYRDIGGAEQVIARAKATGVEILVCSGFDLESSMRAAELAEAHEGVYFCAGFHPSELYKYKEGDLKKIAEICRADKCVALGEIGLDYHFYNNPPKEFQREIFIKQLSIANELELPVVLHSRDAGAETLAILRKYRSLLNHGGLMHCYSYSPEMVDDFCQLGLHFSFGGPCTFNKAEKVWESVKRVPDHLLLSETDCPYLTPMPLRGTFPNEPKNIKFVVERMASLKETSVETLQKQIEENTKSLFFKIK